MKTKHFVSRLMHAKSRPTEAINRIISRSILRLLGIDLSLETEIQYVELGTFKSQITRKELLHDNCFVSFRKNSKEFQHSFDPRYLVEITNVIVNTSTNHIYVLDSDSKRRYLLRPSGLLRTPDSFQKQTKSNNACQKKEHNRMCSLN